ncbi:HPF/RaiA family ribosome-associated protein [Bradymonas sediminis]|uniref:30S ribosomal protein S30 n=1 Tax=Bradymonas sediminis TaxID=1548548 RepID=A0A2Z4FG22_9DELT|nr:HPF/RaiA family ribosome-associated protein [Bradymonas sediminis]AWV87863.1 30S ribosomal protein S30 [Bradymonas sediminis]TDP62876.1 ribosomal subunit interface protein [Bradymonas sediminis]
MKTPLELSFTNLTPSEPLKERVYARVARLERFFQGIIACRVFIEISNKSPHNIQDYSVRIALTVPGQEIAVSANPRPNERGHRDAYVAIRDAFDTAERRLKDYSARLREARKTPTPTEEPVAVVTRLFPERGYGFLEDPGGREIYFHQNAVINQGFDKLNIGAGVQFDEGSGLDGPQATRVRTI